MREIKFRAWDISEKTMTYFEPLARTITYNQLACQPISGDNDDTSIDTHTSEPTDKVILMQYTGLKDKNEKEIYEGDIVKFIGQANYLIGQGSHSRINDLITAENIYNNIIEDKLYNLFIVKYVSSGFIGVRNMNQQSSLEEIDLAKSFIFNKKGLINESFEIIGNIYENPSLIAQK